MVVDSRPGAATIVGTEIASKSAPDGCTVLMITTTISAAPHIKACKLRALAITGLKRQSSMPEVPTAVESLPGYHAEAFQGMVVPAGTPQVIVDKPPAEVARVVKLPDVARRFQLAGAEVVGSTAKEFAAFLKAEMQKWRNVIRDAGIKPEQ